MSEQPPHDDDLFFAEEGEEVGKVPLHPWRILVVDDDQDVHEATVLALRGLEVLDRPMQLLHAHSANEALDCLRRETDIAVILLDVVMETLTAGLDIVATIRGELGLVNLRIVLRTGQPGYAPEIETIRRYDINDYKAKSELTRNKLFTVLSSACRTYDQLCRGEASRHGLERIVTASRQLMREREMSQYAERALEQLAAYLNVPNDGFICMGETAEVRRAGLFMLRAASGRYARASGKPLALTAPELLLQVEHCLETQASSVTPDGVFFYFGGSEGRRGAGAGADRHRPVLGLQRSFWAPLRRPPVAGRCPARRGDLRSGDAVPGGASEQRHFCGPRARQPDRSGGLAVRVLHAVRV